MNTSLSIVRPQKPVEFTQLQEQAKDGLNMTQPERMRLAEQVRQAYYGYTPETAPKMARVFTFVNTKTNEIISKHFF